MRQFVFIVWLLATAPLWATGAHAQREPQRIALLIGNQGYGPKVGALRNPHNDVTLIERALKSLGFKVTVLRDAGYRKMDVAIKEHIAAVREAGRGAISFVYYSGHGVANPKTNLNYLIPVDVPDAGDRKLWSLAFEQNDLIDKLNRQAPRATHYVVFDACRNELMLPSDGKAPLGAEKGFVPVPQTAGLLVAYSTAPKQTASDIGEGGGPYAKVLAEELVRPGIEAVAMFRNVQLRVKQTIGQDPWLSFPSLPEVYLAGPPAPPQPSEAARAWDEARKSASVAVLEAFSKQFPGTVYSALATERIAELRKQEADTERQRVAALQKQDEATRARAAEKKRLDDEAAAKLRAETDRKRQDDEQKRAVAAANETKRFDDEAAAKTRAATDAGAKAAAAPSTAAYAGTWQVTTAWAAGCPNPSRTLHVEVSQSGRLSSVRIVEQSSPGLGLASPTVSPIRRDGSFEIAYRIVANEEIAENLNGTFAKGGTARSSGSMTCQGTFTIARVPPGPRLLASQLAELRTDRDNIPMHNEAGPLTRVALRTRDGDLYVRTLTLHFSSGEPAQQERIEALIKAGSQTRWIEVPRGRRLRDVQVSYAARSDVPHAMRVRLDVLGDLDRSDEATAGAQQTSLPAAKERVPEATKASGLARFDGKWRLERSSAGCTQSTLSTIVTIRSGSVSAATGAKGSVTAAGVLAMEAVGGDGGRGNYAGEITASRGGGRYVGSRPGSSSCTGTFTLTRM